MEEHENIYEKIREILGDKPGNLKVLDYQIDMDLQMEYYECSKRLRNEIDEEWAIEHEQFLREPGYSVEVKKTILARLATIDRVECYRAIESYFGEAEDVMKDWALLALNESRIMLEGELLDENQVFISTGLGGREHKLRYFVVLLTRSMSPLTSTQKKVIQNEFKFIERKYEAEIEELKYSDYLAAVLLLLPMEHSLKLVFREAIDECNSFGNFLMEDFIITNVKTLSFEEIKSYLKENSAKGPAKENG